MKLVFILFLCTLACSVASDGDQLEGSLSGLEEEDNLETSLRLKRGAAATPYTKTASTYTPKTYTTPPKMYSATKPHTATTTTYDKPYTKPNTYATPSYTPPTPATYTAPTYSATPPYAAAPPYTATYTPPAPAYGTPAYMPPTYPGTPYVPTVPYAPYGTSPYVPGGYDQTVLTGDQVQDVMTVLLGLWNINLPGPPTLPPETCLGWVEHLLEYLPKYDVLTILTVVKNLLYNIGSYNSRQSAMLVGIELTNLKGRSDYVQPEDSYNHLSDEIGAIITATGVLPDEGKDCKESIDVILDNLNDEALDILTSLLIYLFEKNYNNNANLQNAAYLLREVLGKHYLPVLTLDQLTADPEYTEKGYLLGSETLEDVMKTQCAPYTINKYKTGEYNDKLAALLKKAILEQLGADGSYNKPLSYAPAPYVPAPYGPAPYVPAPAPYAPASYATPPYAPAPYDKPAYTPPTYGPAAPDYDAPTYAPQPYDKPSYKPAPAKKYKAPYAQPPPTYKDTPTYDDTPSYDTPAPTYDDQPSYTPSTYEAPSPAPAPSYKSTPAAYNKSYKGPNKKAYGKPPYKGNYRSRRDAEGSAEE